MDLLSGTDMWLRFFLAFVIVLALIGGTAYLVRRFGADRLGAASARGRQPRLAVIDAAAVDGRRRLVLIRRDNVEHLLMIGGPTDVVIEPNIVRTAAAPGATPRPPAAPADTLPRAVPLPEGNMWPLQPAAEPAPPPPPPARPQRPVPPPMEEPAQWHTEPDLPPPPARAPRLEPRPEPRVNDPLAGLAAELSRQPMPPVPPAARPRPPRERDITRARDREPMPSRPLPMPPPPAEEPAPADADQNLADMASRLEAALRRPKASDGRAPDSGPRPLPAVLEPDTMQEAPSATAPEPEPVAHRELPPPPRLAPRNPNAATPNPSPSAPPPAPKASVYDSLEQEMASLLGRPKN